MKDKWAIIRKYLPWFVMLILFDVFFCIVLWIADINAFYILSILLILVSIISFVIMIFIMVYRESKWKKAFEEYIAMPTEQNEETLIELSSKYDQSIIRLLGQSFKDKEYENNQLVTQVTDYEEYVESWAHEIKMPISLLTILLDNHRDEIPDSITVKMDYVRNRMQEYVDQMLFYARLKGEKKDYFFEKISLEELLDDVLEDYAPLLEEKEFVVRKEFLETTAFSDKRGLKFLIGQILSNSIKYTKADKSPQIELRYELVNDMKVLTIKDNGIGVKACDLSFVFEKGFTGDSGEQRKSATGMGLYLAKEIATQLNLGIGFESEWMEGVEIKIIFPLL